MCGEIPAQRVGTEDIAVAGVTLVPHNIELVKGKTIEVRHAQFPYGSSGESSRSNGNFGGRISGVSIRNAGSETGMG